MPRTHRLGHLHRAARGSLVLASALLAGACGSATTNTGGPVTPASDASASKKPHPTGILLSQETPEHLLPRWKLYAVARAVMWEELRRPTDKRHNKSADDFTIELGARSALIELWDVEKAHQPGLADVYLDELTAVSQAGFMQEYVLTYFSRPGWTVPSAVYPAIDLAGFREWSKVHLANHVVQQHAMFNPPRGSLYPEPPGAALPDPSRVSTASCERDLPALTTAAASWATEARSLDGAPLAAANRATFLAALEYALKETPPPTPGVTWVLPRATDVLFMAGYCAVQVGRFTEAQDYLRNAIRLSPRSSGLYSELAMALIPQKDLDGADQAIDRAIALTSEHCALARGWRAKGFILFERGRLPESYQAYDRSLELDPGSALARTEMKSLVQAMRRNGGPEVKDSKGIVPPSIMTTTGNCKP